MASSILKRVFLASGTVPDAVTPAHLRLFARCPRERLVRAVAWYVLELARGSREAHLADGVRALIRGWDDFYITMTLPRGVVLVNVEASAQRGQALVTRPGRIGRGWAKESVATTGSVRPDVDLATRWLQSVVGCVIHDDCAAVPALGLACESAMQTV